MDKRTRAGEPSVAVGSGSRARENASFVPAARSFWNRRPLFAGESAFVPGQREFFDEHAKTLLYEFSNEIPAIFVAGVGPGSRVLDAGCGIGFWTQEFCRRGAQVVAFDLSDQSAALTLQRVRVFDLAGVVAVASVDQIPVPDGTFDHVNCLNVLNYLPDPEPCFQEMHRILRPGGTLTFAGHYKGWFLSPTAFKAAMFMSRLLLTFKDASRAGMTRAPSPEEFIRAVDGAENPFGRAFSLADLRAAVAGRFEVVEKQRGGLPLRTLPFRLPKAVRRVLNRCFGVTIVLRCRKARAAVAGETIGATA